MRDCCWRRSVGALAAMLCIMAAGHAGAQEPSAIERIPLEAPAAEPVAPLPPPAAAPPAEGAEVSNSPVYTLPQGVPPAEIELPVARIEWRVENPFRFFKNASDTEIHRATWLSLEAAKRAEPILAAERALSSRHPDGWAATMIDDVCWSQTRNRYDCGGGAAYVLPETHAVLLTLTGVEDQRVDCTWLTAPDGTAG